MWFTHTSEPRSPLPREVVHTLGQRLQWTETWTRHLPLVLHYRSTASVCSELIFSKKDLIILWIARLYCILFFFLMSEAFIFSNVNNENISWYFNLVLAFLCFYFLNTLWVSKNKTKNNSSAPWSPSSSGKPWNLPAVLGRTKALEVSEPQPFSSGAGVSKSTPLGCSQKILKSLFLFYLNSRIVNSTVWY